MSAALLYLWGIIILWMAPEWELSGWTYYVVGIFPVIIGVVSLTTALGLYMDLREADDEGDPDPS